MAMADHKVHIFTDDPEYRKCSEKAYEWAVNGGLLDFGTVSRNANMMQPPHGQLAPFFNVIQA